MHLEPFRIAVPQAVLADLRERLARTRFPDEIPGSGWTYGTNLAYLRELVAYWRERFDWRAAEARLNGLPQFRARVGGLGIHFIHVRGTGPAPLPLVVTHGWPGSVAEFLDTIGPLTDPARHGGDPADAFDVVAPSMPGYGFSDHPTEPGMDPERIAALWAELMAGLGYQRFGAQGGDWGAMVTTYLGARHAARVLGIHLNMVIALPEDPQNPSLEGLTQEEIVDLMAVQQFLKEETGYQRIQGTKPQTLAYALNDSPAGLAAWIVEKFRTWSDCDGEIERRFTKDQLLTNIMLYWVPRPRTPPAASITRPSTPTSSRPAGSVSSADGCAIFPREIIKPPRAWPSASSTCSAGHAWSGAATSRPWRSRARWWRTSGRSSGPCAGRADRGRHRPPAQRPFRLPGRTIGQPHAREAGPGPERPAVGNRADQGCTRSGTSSPTEWTPASRPAAPAGPDGRQGVCLTSGHGRQLHHLDLGAVLRSPFGPTACAGASHRAGLLPPAGRRRGAGPHSRGGVESACGPGRRSALLARSRERGGRRGVRREPEAAGTRGLGAR